MQEQEIIELLLQKNEKGIDALLLHYGPLMRYVIAPILQNPHEQEDCLSEVTIRVWEKIEQFKKEQVLQVERSRIGLTLAIRSFFCPCTSFSYVLLRLIRFCFFLPAAPGSPMLLLLSKTTLKAVFLQFFTHSPEHVVD